MSDFIHYKSSSPAGDLISFMAGIREMWVKTGKRGIVFQRLNVIGVSYHGAIHPFENERGEPVTMNQYMFDMLRPLILSQPYIEDYREFNGEHIDFDFDQIRLEKYTGQPNYALNRWPFMIFPQMNCDLSKPWIEFAPTVINPYKEKVIVNFTQRHRQNLLHYHFMKPFQEHLVFAGLQKERDIFCTEYDLDIPLLQVDNFFELARIISGCRFFVGNQSFCYQLAEATKCPRMLELFPLIANVVPSGGIAKDYFHQDCAKYFFESLITRGND